MNPENIKDLLEETFSVDISKRTRKREVIEIRYMYYYICYWLFPKMTYQQLCESIGFKKHEVVIYAVNNYPDHIKYDKRCKMRFSLVDKEIGFSEYVNQEFKIFEGMDQGALKRRLIKVLSSRDSWEYKYRCIKRKLNTLEEKTLKMAV